MSKFTVGGLFSGVGGIELGFEKAGFEILWSNEIDKYACTTYRANHLHKLYEEDIRDFKNRKLPSVDILTGGFPCQAFSVAGYRKGFNDDRGNMFFEIMRFVDAHQPKALFLENVRHLINHDDGRTFSTIKEQITKRGYSFNYKVVKASDFNLPQHRPRVFIICLHNDVKNRDDFEFAEPIKLTMFMSDIFGEPCNKSIGYTLRVGGKSSGINDRRNWDTYMVNGGIKKITSKEGKAMNGFPDDFVFPVSETQAMKQLGNSVAVHAVKATGKKLIELL